jgi:hypothetical protein
MRLLSEGVENHPARDSKPEKPKLDEAPPSYSKNSPLTKDQEHTKKR